MRSDRLKMVLNGAHGSEIFPISAKIGAEIGYLQNKYYFCLVKNADHAL